MSWCLSRSTTCDGPQETRLSELRIPADIAEAAIGHAKRGLERVYNQHEFKDEIRTALQAWADRLRSIVGEPAPTPPADVSNVVALRGVCGDKAQALSTPGGPASCHSGMARGPAFGLFSG